MPRQIIDPESGDKRFDAKVHIRDHKGTMTQVKPYQKIVRDGVSVFKDKNGFYYEDGSDVPHKVLVQLGLVKPPKKEATKPQQQAPQDQQAPQAQQTQAPQPTPVGATSESPAPSGEASEGGSDEESEVTPGDEEDVDPEPHADDQGTTGL